MRDTLFIGALGLLPKNAWSRAIGAVAHAPLPRPICQAAIRAFAKAYDINVDDAELPLDAYRTVGEFFTRRLRSGARPIDRRPGFAVAPCDGKVLNSGRISNGTLIQAKGRRFSLNELLQSNTEAAQFENGSWITIYLSPQDYHRVHHPVEGEITAARYVPGHLWPVNRPSVEQVPDLFCINERLITYVDSPLGAVATIMVGATSVGRITTAYDASISTNTGQPGGRREYPSGLRAARGDELGIFHLGSTAIVLFSDPAVNLLPLKDGEAVRLGSAVARRG
ncbi:MAG: phosphatidylserine decarboxylase [Bradymonadia bacterium]